MCAGKLKAQVKFFVCCSVPHPSISWSRLLCEVDLVIKPSRTEGFGISGLRAISADIPVLVSGNCGLGMVLKSLPSGAQHVISSEDPQAWADAIKKVRAKAVQVRREESEQLRNDYMQQFNWKIKCDEIVKKMFSMNPHKSGNFVYCNFDLIRKGLSLICVFPVVHSLHPNISL